MPSGKRDGDAITNTSGRPFVLTLEKQCTEIAILDSIDPMISLLSGVVAAMVTKSELRKRSVEADLPQDLKAYIVARLVSSIDMYFPHVLPERELLSGQCLRNLITQCLASETRADFYFLCQAFMASFHNGHTEFYDRWLFEVMGAPTGFHAAPADGQWAVTESRIDGLFRGDVILRIDDQPIDLFFAARKDLISASTKHYAEHAFFFSPLLFPQNFAITLEGGEVINVQRNMNRPVERCKVSGKTEDGICMLKVQSFEEKEHEQILQTLKACQPFDGLLLDLRGNCGGSTPIEFIKQLVPGIFRLWSDASIVHVGLDRAEYLNARVGDQCKQSEPLWEARAQIVQPAPILHGHAEEAFTGPIVILQDARTASAAEDFIQALLDAGRVTLVGSTSAGSSGQPYFEDFGNGMKFRVSAKAERFPDGSQFEGIGILPHHRVHPTISSLKTGKDPVCQKGIGIMKQQLCA